MKIKKIVNRCFICNKIVKENKNDFEITCEQHRGLAELSTKLFFEKNPIFKQWKNLTHNKQNIL